MQDVEGWATLMNASGEGHIGVVGLLLDRGAAIEMQDEEGCTALIWASGEGHVEVARLLLDRGG